MDENVIQHLFTAGINAQKQGKLQDTLESYTNLVKYIKELRPDPQDQEAYHSWLAHYGYDLARVYSNRGVLLKILHEAWGARKYYKAAIDICEQSRLYAY
ncbi:hypothetical protein TI04_03900 [Achromatium sp. WMS2]|nr:hypothetical protein TI04_03900 [Achromatium sp. WMS2]